MRNFLKHDDGASTVEFVVLLPFLICTLGLIVSASLYLAMASDVQQLAHELARSAIQVSDDDDWCDEIRTTMVEPLANNLPLLNPARVSEVSCSRNSDTRLLQVTVNYDTSPSLGAILGSTIGLRINSFQRSSFVQW
ncbi:TadE/TadG family type IV pilus assembly protein [Pararhodobacter sp. CCB-MM2]|uniref:TadE/TadG family type IV pilus assembly protein n=1 Tax=Pararhodobacter sp. CCB-MM2 TaxID=1786003 RepID=UPI00082D4D2C|nr:TadE/TadG family type IV pilus assembly protein [Pararhodobacter sp. CCB-MM2]